MNLKLLNYSLSAIAGPLALVTAVSPIRAADKEPNILYIVAEHPEIVATLQKRAQELAAAGVKPLFMEEGFEEIVRWSHLPPAFPGEEFDQEK